MKIKETITTFLWGLLGVAILIHPYFLMRILVGWENGIEQFTYYTFWLVGFLLEAIIVFCIGFIYWLGTFIKEMREL